MTGEPERMAPDMHAPTIKKSISSGVGDLPCFPPYRMNTEK